METSTTSRVVVCVTREKHQQRQILVQQHPLSTAGSYQLALPGTELRPGEHPAEAAFRVLNQVIEQDSCPMFHKLAQVALDDSICHVFQTSPEQELPEDICGFEWRAQSEASSLLDSDGVWLTALSRLE